MAAFDIILAQHNTLVGDFDGNLAKILAGVERAEGRSERPVLIFPELTLCGYPPEDLLFHSGLRHDYRRHQKRPAMRSGRPGSRQAV